MRDVEGRGGREGREGRGGPRRSAGNTASFCMSIPFGRDHQRTQLVFEGIRHYR